MKDDQYRFLSLLNQLPARLTAEQTAWALNCQAHDVPILVATRLLKPLGRPRPNSVKYFATTDVLSHAQDRVWLSKMTVVIGLHWQERNRWKTSANPSASTSGLDR